MPIPADVVAKIGEPPTSPPPSLAKTYENQNDAVTSVAVQNFLVTHEGVSNDTVHAMTKSMFENLDQMVAAHAAAKAISRKRSQRGHRYRCIRVPRMATAKPVC